MAFVDQTARNDFLPKIDIRSPLLMGKNIRLFLERKVY